ncbi:MAG: hypothetical protein IJD42_05835 [Clostridia bacterium]|nr:hypothetical protein [Clostridia bacterium]
MKFSPLKSLKRYSFANIRLICTPISHLGCCIKEKILRALKNALTTLFVYAMIESYYYKLAYKELK